MLSSSAMASATVISGGCESPLPRSRAAVPSAGRTEPSAVCTTRDTSAGRDGRPLAAAGGRPGGPGRHARAAGPVRSGQRAGAALLAAERPGLLLRLAYPPADHGQAQDPR